MYRHIQNIKGVSFFGILRFLYKFKGSSCEEELVAMLTKEEQKVLDIEDSRYAHFNIHDHLTLWCWRSNSQKVICIEFKLLKFIELFILPI